MLMHSHPKCWKCPAVHCTIIFSRRPYQMSGDARVRALLILLAALSMHYPFLCWTWTSHWLQKGYSASIVRVWRLLHSSLRRGPELLPDVKEGR